MLSRDILEVVCIAEINVKNIVEVHRGEYITTYFAESVETPFTVTFLF